MEPNIGPERTHVGALGSTKRRYQACLGSRVALMILPRYTTLRERLLLERPSGERGRSSDPADSDHHIQLCPLSFCFRSPLTIHRSPVLSLHNEPSHQEPHPCVKAGKPSLASFPDSPTFPPRRSAYMASNLPPSAPIARSRRVRHGWPPHSPISRPHQRPRSKAREGRLQASCTHACIHAPPSSGLTSNLPRTFPLCRICPSLSLHARGSCHHAAPRPRLPCRGAAGAHRRRQPRQRRRGGEGSLGAGAGADRRQRRGAHCKARCCRADVGTWRCAGRELQAAGETRETSRKEGTQRR